MLREPARRSRGRMITHSRSPVAAVEAQLRAAGRTVAAPIVFPGTASAVRRTLRMCWRWRASCAPPPRFPIVVGSGTLNDITKLAAHRSGRQYMCVGTASSMDGYTAFGAAITLNGFKQTMACAGAARAASRPGCTGTRAHKHERDRLRRPARQNHSRRGLALADALEIEPIDPRAWPLVQDSLARMDWPT